MFSARVCGWFGLCFLLCVAAASAGSAGLQLDANCLKPISDTKVDIPQPFDALIAPGGNVQVADSIISPALRSEVMPMWRTSAIGVQPLTTEKPTVADVQTVFKQIEIQNSLPAICLAADQVASTVLDHADQMIYRISTEPQDPAVYLIRDHGAAYSRWEMALMEKHISQPAILVHVDAHQDLCDDPLSSPSNSFQEAVGQHHEISGFISPAVANGYVDEIYWVKASGTEITIPVWISTVVFVDKGGEPILTTDGKQKSKTLVTERNPYRPYHTVLDVTDDKEYSLSAIEDLNFRASERAIITEVKIIPLHMILLKSLPDFSKSKRPIILDIDEDYISYTAAGNAGSLFGDRYTVKSWDENAVAEEANTVLQACVEKNLHPFVVTLAISPGYTPDNMMQPITADLLTAMDKSGIAKITDLDYPVKAYTHK